LFGALGLGSQIVQVDPGSGTIVVRLGAQRRPVKVAPFVTKNAAEVTVALAEPDLRAATKAVGGLRRLLSEQSVEESHNLAGQLRQVCGLRLTQVEKADKDLRIRVLTGR